MKRRNDFERFNLRHLRYFLAVCEYGSFRAASAVLNIAQSAVSRRVGDLERVFGMKLLERHARGVTLTEAGRLLQRRAQRIYEEIKAGRGRLDRYRRGDDGRLRIGMFGTTSRLSFVPGLIERYRQEWPQIEIDLLAIDQREVDAATLATLDLVFHEGGHALPDHGEGVPLYRGQHLLALPHGHDLAGMPSVSLALLAGQELICFPRSANPTAYDQLIREAAGQGQALSIVHENLSECSRLAFAAAGMGIAIVSPLAIYHDQQFAVEYRPIAGIPFDFGLWLSARDKPSNVSGPFVEIATGYLASLM